jgi:nucleoid-associated protein YgaU
MSIRRLVTTTAVMALVGVLLSALTPSFAEMAASLATPQRTADTVGPDALVLSAAGLLAWTVWAWGALGLALTAATALPGVLGGCADLAVRVVLPAGARRAAALTLGLGLGVAGPLLGTAVQLVAVPAAAAPTAPVPDWPGHPDPAAPGPAAIPPAVPDWPVPPGAGAPAPVPDWPADSHVVLRGDCLWHIAAGRLQQGLGRPPTDAEVAHDVRAWWTANAHVIGPDPDVLLPGQVLRPPDRP